MTLEYITIAYGIGLLVASGWFWTNFGRRPNNRGLPSMTTLVTWGSVITMLLLIGNNQLIPLIFGNDAQATRDNIFMILGQLFIGFILIITISWGLMGRTNNIPQARTENNSQGRNTLANAVYVQSYLLVGLFFFLVLSFIDILIGL